MYRFLPLAVLFATSSFAGTLDKIPPRNDVPDAVLDSPDLRGGSLILRNSRETFQKRFPEQSVELLAHEIQLLDSLLDKHDMLRLHEKGVAFEPRDEKQIKESAFEPWRDLFNGKDIENWKVVGKALWKVEDGVIVGGQFGDPKRGGLLHTAESFTDFELELEFMIDEHGKYNSGVYLRNDAGTAARTGYQVNIGRGAAGEFCGGVYTTDWLAKGDETDTVRKINAWNKFRILAIGAHVEVDLNGKRIVTLDDAKPDPKFLQKGVIGFQTYGAEGHDGWVKFKNIRIREVKK